MPLLREALDPLHTWRRIADPAWADPLDATWSARLGGRWNPPGSIPALYLNEDSVTARFNLTLFLRDWPYGPEDLKADAAPVLVDVRLPGEQVVADMHTPAGIEAAGLPPTFPFDDEGIVISQAHCQPVGTRARTEDLAGVRARSAQTPRGEGRELAWFPADGATATTIAITPFADWYWA